MTSIADVQAIWLSAVFENSNIIAITENILDYQYTDGSQTEIERLYKLGNDGIGIINFFEYLVDISNERIVEVGGQASPEKEFVVDVRYTKTLDPNGLAESEVKEAIEAVKDTVRIGLGATWSTLNVKTDLVISTQAVTREEVNGSPCVRQIVTFRAFKQ